ncbi:hypothetical protein BDF22DRAFT_696516 [Syncephalis plumigaleata]|nr:hypothetical protein BDF22DRAFT_696516 [Syncephalis plumigaleata]
MIIMFTFYHTITLIVSILLSILVYGSSIPPDALPSTYPKGALMAPVAKTKHFQHQHHGYLVDDPYQWMENRELNTLSIGELLKNETTYAQQVLKESRPLRTQVYNEILASLDGRLYNVQFSGNYMYYGRYHVGKPHLVYFRKEIGVDNAQEEPILDVNAFKTKAGKVGKIMTAKGETLLAFTLDPTGDEIYTLYFKDLVSGDMLQDVIPNVMHAFEWSVRGKSILYVSLHHHGGAESLQRHVIGTPVERDSTVIYIGPKVVKIELTRSNNKKLFFFENIYESGVEHFVLDMSSERYVVPLRYSFPLPGYLFKIFHLDQQLLFGKVLRDTKLNSYEISNFHRHLAIFDHSGLVTQIRVYKFDDEKILQPNAKPYIISFPAESYRLHKINQPFNSHKLLFAYSSLITPNTIYSYDMDTGEMTKIHQDSIPDYDESNYATKVIYAQGNRKLFRARHNVPITIAYRKGITLNGHNYAWLNGYGAYGSIYQAQADYDVTTLLKHGFIYAFAHIRGGGEFGVKWWSKGAGYNKKNSFNDFILSINTLVSKGYTKHELLTIEGDSAGGMVVGAVINDKPNIAKVAILNAPFLNNKKLYEYISSYSPYDNITPNTKYPNILVTIGINDPRVPYWDPIKWVAKLRASNVENPSRDVNPHTIATLIDMNNGHSR